MTRASFLQRFLAFVIDAILISVVGGGLALVFGGLSTATLNAEGGVANALTGLMGFTLNAIIFLLEFLYFGYFWSTSGQSIGMKVMGIRVISNKSGNLPFVMAGLRGSVGYWISGLLCGLGFIWAAFDAKQEAWHDKIFSSAVMTA
jgi:uncharacterized RDD family membrane protein YckC